MGGIYHPRKDNLTSRWLPLNGGYPFQKIEIVSVTGGIQATDDWEARYSFRAL